MVAVVAVVAALVAVVAVVAAIVTAVAAVVAVVAAVAACEKEGGGSFPSSTVSDVMGGSTDWREGRASSNNSFGVRLL